MFMEGNVRTSTEFTSVEFIQKISTLSERYILKSSEWRKYEKNSLKCMVCEQVYLYVGTLTQYQYALIHTP
jgi:hypothetical protein